ncbi:MAG: hypothetical protein FJ167_14285 [Gammaproteobacteria bacterium]|jgi:hypothetical protein|nr:hypothetical protein [Gammaproteobacteria bacterium]
MDHLDDRTNAALEEIAALLATAYRRHHRSHRLAAGSGAGQPIDPIELALRRRESVHVHEVDA